MVVRGELTRKQENSQRKAKTIPFSLFKVERRRLTLANLKTGFPIFDTNIVRLYDSKAKFKSNEFFVCRPEISLISLHLFN